MDSPCHPAPSRRHVALAAWAAPAILTAAAAPAASASNATETRAPRYSLDSNGTNDWGTMILGEHWSDIYSPTDGLEYFNYSSPKAYLYSNVYKRRQEEYTEDDWSLERREAAWENLVPGKAYTFTMKVRCGPVYHCPAGTEGKVILIYTSPTGTTWNQNANLRSHPKARKPKEATAPETLFEFPLPDDYCSSADTDLWGAWKTITFTETAGPDGKIHFRYDAWMEPRTQDAHYYYRHPNDTYMTQFHSGSAFFNWTRPEIVA